LSGGYSWLLEGSLGLFAMYFARLSESHSSWAGRYTWLLEGGLGNSALYVAIQSSESFGGLITMHIEGLFAERIA
jgi:hypothetical protein